MASFGKTSLERLSTCHIDIQTICNYVIVFFDFSILEGARTDKLQQEYFNAVPPKTTLDGIHNKSKHQVTEEQPLSMAVDGSPYPIDFSDKLKSRARFYMWAGYMFMASEILYDQGKITHKLRWGGDWDSDKNFKDQSFDDLPHLELIKI